MAELCFVFGKQMYHWYDLPALTLLQDLLVLKSSRTSVLCSFFQLLQLTWTWSVWQQSHHQNVSTLPSVGSILRLRKGINARIINGLNIIITEKILFQTWFSGHSSWDKDNVGSLQAVMQLFLSQEATDLGTCLDVTKVSSHAWCVCDIIQVQVCDGGHKLQEQRQRLPNPSWGTQHCHLHILTSLKHTINQPSTVEHQLIQKPLGKDYSSTY